MEKIGADEIYQDLQDGCIGWDNEYYPAPEVDAYRAAVKALVEAAAKFISPLPMLKIGLDSDWQTERRKQAENIKQAIAAVERLEG